MDQQPLIGAHLNSFSSQKISNTTQATKTVKRHKQQYGTGGKNPIGGTKYDITRGSRKKRASHTFDKKDPFADVIEKDLKEGNLDFA